MTFPFTLPDWLPGWVVLLLALPALLWACAFLLMPFSVFGVKARLEALEAQINQLQDDLRIMAMRYSGALPSAPRSADVPEDVPDFARLKKARPGFAETPEPPLPPPEPRRAPGGALPGLRERLAAAPPPPASRPRRTEPRLD